MAGSVTPTPLETQGLAETVGALVPSAASLIRRVTGVEPAVREHAGSEVRISSPLIFSDGVGDGEVVGSIFRYRGQLRFDIAVEHDRVFGRPDGTPTAARCYLNDYMASIRLPFGADALPVEFVREVVSGVAAARDAVRRWNRGCESNWFRVTVAVRPSGAGTAAR